MKFFQSLQNLLENMGVCQPQPFKEHSVSLQSFLRLACTGMFSTLCLVSFAIESEKLQEYAEAFYVFSTSTFIFSIILTFVTEAPKIFELMNGCENFIEKRKIIVHSLEKLISLRNHCNDLYCRKRKRFNFERIFRENQIKERNLDQTVGIEYHQSVTCWNYNAEFRYKLF